MQVNTLYRYFFTSQLTIKIFLVWQSFQNFSHTHKDKLLSAHRLIFKFIFTQLTQLSDEELKNWKQLIKADLLLTLKLIHFSSPFDMTNTSKINLHSSCIIICKS